MKKPKNPYVIGNSVGGEPTFVGRDDVLREVLNVLHNDNQNAIVLYGQRRIGKSSVLKELEAKLPQEENFLPVFFDLQDKAKWSLATLLQELASTITDNLSNNTPDSDLGNDPETTFRDSWLPKILKNLPTEKSLVLLFDEFDVLDSVDDKQANVAFFPYLRNLLDKTDRQRLNFVFVIGRNIRELNSIMLALFKRIPSKRVSLLNKNDTVKLIRFSEANHTLEWSDQAIEQVWKTTNGHPLMTQCLCSTIWNAANYDNKLNTIVASEKVDMAIPNTMESMENIMNWLWEGLGPAERVVASVLAGAGADPMTETRLNALLKKSGVKVMIHELEDAPNLLLEKGWDLIESVKPNSYRFRVELLRRWIEENEPISRVREEIDNINREASEYYRTAMNSYESDRWQEACEYLQYAIEKNPNHAKASVLLANILLEQGQIEDACREMGRLYKYQPDSVQSQFRDQLLDLAKNKEDEEEQLKLYQQISKLDPDAEEIKEIEIIWRQKGDEAYEAGELETAFRYYKKAGLNEQAIEVQWEMQRHVLPVDKIADWYNKAIEAQQNGQTKKAQALLAGIIATDPTYIEAIDALYRIETGTVLIKDRKLENSHIILSIVTTILTIIAMILAIISIMLVRL